MMVFVFSIQFYVKQPSVYNNNNYFLHIRKCEYIHVYTITIVCYNMLLDCHFSHLMKHLHPEKSPARSMLFYSTNYWQQF